MKIVFDNPGQLEPYAIGPGMSAVPTVDVAAAGEAAGPAPPAAHAR